MKKLLFALLVLLVVGCKKTDGPELNPDLTIGLTGIYPLTLYKESREIAIVPAKDASGLFQISRVDMTTIRAKLTITTRGVMEEYSTNNFELRRDARNAKLFSVLISGQAYGTMTANEIDLSATSPDGTVTEVKARR